jgi:nitric oxide reductase large subunit
MTGLTGTIIAGSTLLKLVVGAVVAGLGVTLAFSLVIYCADRAITARRGRHRTQALLFEAAFSIALVAIVGVIVYGLILTISKPK